MKRFLVLTLAAALVLSLAACGGGTGDSNTPGGSENIPPVDSEPQGAEPSLPEEPSANVDDSTPPATEDNSELPSAEDDVSLIDTDMPLLAVGETISVDEKCDFYLDYVSITTDVMPPQPGSFYSHYEADAGKVYVDVCVAYKNLGTRNIGADEVMTGTLIYSGKYEYNGFSMIEEDSRGDFTYSNITSIAPLSTEYVHYLFSVPEEVQTNANAVDVILTIAGGEYRVAVKEGATGTVTPSGSDNTTQKTSGNITLGETVVTKSSEFFVDYTDITSDVMPRQPGSFYSHYEADDGKVYVDFCVGYKNTSSQNVGADDVISATLKYADRYDYTGFSMIEEDSRGDFTYSNITSIAPLSTEYIHYLFSVPEEVESSSDTIVISFRIDGNDYTYTVR